jgi:hypothetical protein
VTKDPFHGLPLHPLHVLANVVVLLCAAPSD